MNWKPLKNAPNKDIFIRCKGSIFISRANDENRCEHEGAEYLEVPDEELDRAVQLSVAVTFAHFLSDLHNYEEDSVRNFRDGIHASFSGVDAK